MPEFDRVAVLGGGTMGRGIAQVAAQAGCQVTVVETSGERLDAAIVGIGDFLDGGVRRGKITQDERAAVLERVRGTTSIADLTDIQLVIEAVTEDRAVKRELLAEVAGTVPEGTVIVTNTSALAVSDLATAVRSPQRFAGLHFFNPAPLMKVVEVVRALQTSQEVFDRLMAFTGELGKDAVPVKDRPGFLVNRLLMPYLNDVIQAFDDGLATAEDLDTAIRLGLGYKQGPMELLDMIGLDVHEHAARSAYEAILDPAFAPPPLLQAMVAAGRLGNKTSNGFRDLEVDA
ncbi:3-hydroxyacyl-CoA dehydrogenase NAD-binding domain-containing protein [Nocardia sp. R6R-6]|uniref:3-hydroxyacyl-CoA dehydrogenase NAD-binding domain-containing protein n=1 Tax=Nocardia sp. R6R-6 TaxID=3459303 RepID=UPI00403D916D